MFNETFWLGLCTLAFFYLLWKPLKRQVLNTLDHKISSIANKLQESEDKAKQAEVEFIVSRQKLAKMQQENKHFIANAKLYAEKAIAMQNKDLEESLKKKRFYAIQRIANKKRSVVHSLHQELMKHTFLLVEYQLTQIYDTLEPDYQLSQKYLVT